ncbi:MAG: tRNA pseudouridine(55) synthase TruB [Caulobacteraceae bacterium]
MTRRRTGEAVDGWVVINKPEGLGSTPAVGAVRRAFGARKAGHAGTLDPLASGVLPIALGEATKTVSRLMAADKVYRFTIAWGEETATGDREGAVIRSSTARPTKEQVAAALTGFVGECEQVPPAFSAVKVEGARAYDLARRGVRAELAPRIVRLDRAEVVDHVEGRESRIEIVCGKGFYVRALARDLAALLGACGHVSALRRTRVGPFGESMALGLAFVEELCHRGAALEALLPVATALDDIPALAVTAEDAFRLTQGRSIVLLPRQVDSVRQRLGASRTVSAFLGEKIVALCEMRAGRLSPSRVFHL